MKPLEHRAYLCRTPGQIKTVESSDTKPKLLRIMLLSLVLVTFKGSTCIHFFLGGPAAISKSVPFLAREKWMWVWRNSWAQWG